MKINEITQLTEGSDAVMSYVQTLDSYVRTPVMHYLRSSNTDAEAISRLSGFLRDSFDDLLHGDREAIKKVISLIKAGR